MDTTQHTGLLAIERLFAAARVQGRTAFLPYFPIGYPTYDESLAIIRALAAAGVDGFEIGIPFSDPLADGPTIQAATQIALENGITVRRCLDAVRTLRAEGVVQPMLLMGYLNPVEIRGAAGFARQAADAGVDGMLLVDLPPEEAPEFREAFAAHGVALVLLASPTTPDARLALLLANARGYLYYVSFAGVTGASERLDPAAAATHMRRIRADSPVPVVAGFGIRDAASAAAMARDADGVVVGSALVAAMAQAPDAAEAARRAAAFLAPLRAALD